MLVHKVTFFLIYLLAATKSTMIMGATLTATPDRAVISENETFQLTVSIDEQIRFDEPDFRVLSRQFEIISQDRNATFHGVDGQILSWTNWTVVLAPRSSGNFLIPPFSLNGAMSEPVEIIVYQATGTNPAQMRDQYAEMILDKNTIFVQEQLLVTYRIFSAGQTREIRSAQDLTIANANVEVVTESTYRKTINNRAYRALEAVYAIHPLKSGTLEIPELTWNLISGTSIESWYKDPKASPGRVLQRIHTMARTVTVNPAPANYAGADWLPARFVTLEQHWNTSPDQFVIGEPLSRTVTVKAVGLRARQLPPVPPTSSDNIKVYSDQPQFDDNKSELGITGSRIESSAVIPTETGELILPSISVVWWDTVNNKEQVAELPAQKITVAPAGIASNTSKQMIGPSTSEKSATTIRHNAKWEKWINYWPLLASNIMLAGTVLLLITAWLLARRRQTLINPAVEIDKQSGTSLKELLRNIHKACANNRPLQCKQSLLQWGKVYFQLPHLASLQEIVHQCNCPKIATELESLSKTLYGKDQSPCWNRRALLSAVYEYQKRNNKKRDHDLSTKAISLKSLYPNQSDLI